MIKSRALALAAGCLLFVGQAVAETWPSRDITLVVPYPPGAVNDNVARVISRELGENLGSAVIVDNRGGAGGLLGVGQVARSTSDGYTLMLTVDAPVALAPVLQDDVAFDPISDLGAIALVGETYLGLAVPKNSHFTSLGEVIAEAKTRPGEIMVGSAGVGSLHHMVIEMIQAETGVELNHIPFNGGAPAVQAAVAGQLDMTFGTLPALNSFLRSGDLRLIAVSKDSRIEAYPDVGTISETVSGVSPVSWVGIYGPVGLPSEVVSKVNEAVSKTLENTEIVQQLANFGFTAATAPAEVVSQRLRTEHEQWKEIATKAGLRP